MSPFRALALFPVVHDSVHDLSGERISRVENGSNKAEEWRMVSQTVGSPTPFAADT